MKKTATLLAVWAVAGTAAAQSSVTLFGVVDATLQHISNTGGASVSRLTNSGFSNSRLGFRGVEDLGGGLSASFWLEAGLNNDDGTGLATNSNNQASGAAPAAAGGQGLTFNRRSTVSLAGPWGEVRLGRDYTPQFWNLTIFDPYGNVGVGATLTFGSIVTGAPFTAARASNSIGYLLPGNLGGFYGQVMHYRGENASNAAGGTASDGTGIGARFGYASGPVNVALALGRTQRAGALGDIRQANIGAQWDLGVARLMGQVSSDKGSASAVAGGPALAADGHGWLLGALVPVGVGVGEVRVSYSQYRQEFAASDNRARKLALGYVHNLSKRTALYTAYARLNNRGGAFATVTQGAGSPAANGSSSGFDVGLRHSF
ncbi:outer membrane protein (porin) [Acidovorax sp. CF316]|uniref:porin n=1 Tax=Acidovorax sp. CF316 TaxID=1144317 RepID=UPI00026BC7DE|nr:porin [Acidovorax sp. CF316]EJE50167.1 outer membrane protein (porin) [Acidovorax sp. CF316]